MDTFCTVCTMRVCFHPLYLHLSHKHTLSEMFMCTVAFQVYAVMSGDNLWKAQVQPAETKAIPTVLN